jgi:energy-coupling factor transport system substrate-specific component
MKNRLTGIFTNLAVFILGFLSLATPFVLPQARSQLSSGAYFPVMVSLILVLCLVILLFEIQTSGLDSKMIAFLGMLIAINAGLRFLENAIPGPAGFSPVFFLIILTGYFFGSEIGFLTGAITMFVSGLITGGVGTWLPGQMITGGWVGQSAALLSWLVDRCKCRGKAGEVVLLAVFSAGWGLLYGAIMNLWFWPYLASNSSQSWIQGAAFLENLQGYSAYYLATSVVWDITRAVGNVLMMVFMARPVLKVLDRFKNRFKFNSPTGSET